ncbi:uncharacterized protein LOC144924054 [Branchiostoma floridae x Branchiostoma belcheri]
MGRVVFLAIFAAVLVQTFAQEESTVLPTGLEPVPTPGPCESEPCLHGGTCTERAGGVACECAPGFQGTHCETETDECTPNPCAHGTCQDLVADYTCHCLQGFMGRNCDQPVPACLGPLPEGSSPWQRNMTGSVVTVEWGYAKETCNTWLTCFGVPAAAAEGVLQVQQKPLEIQEGVRVRFQPDSQEVEFAIQPYKVSREGFEQCSITQGRATTDSPTAVPFELDPEFLNIGSNYFIVNTDSPLFRCDFGLRINITVKPNLCRPAEQPGTDLCNNRGHCLSWRTQGSFSCECCEGYTGQYCEEMDGCHSNPCENGATCLDIRDDLGEGNFTCICPPGYTGASCSDQIDYCAESPCQNGAQCLSVEYGPQCVCLAGFTGDLCQLTLDLCDSRPCQHQGVCRSNVTHYSCECPPGVSGRNCEVNADECASSPCRHGVCVDRVNGYQCYCVPGFNGHHCEHEYDECLSDPCLNNGACVDQLNRFTCECGEGYRGERCEIKVDLCASNPCKNATACIDQGNTVHCVCAPGFTGSQCEFKVNPCQNNPCRHGGTCQPHGSEYICVCMEGYIGKDCTDVSLEAEGDTGFYHSPVFHEHMRILYTVTGILATAFVAVIAVVMYGVCRAHHWFKGYDEFDSSPDDGQRSRRVSIEDTGSRSGTPVRRSRRVHDYVEASSIHQPRPSVQAIYEATSVDFTDISGDQPLLNSLKPKRV